MIGAAIGPLFSFLDDALKRAFPDKTEREKIQAQLQSEMLKGDLGLLQAQLGVNQVEAASTSLFVAGWRPFVGWVCGGALAYNFVAQPFLAFLIGCFAWKLPPLPLLDSGSLTTVLLGMLGIGGMRTFEKLKGVA
jgi:hypothetical protein